MIADSKAISPQKMSQLIRDQIGNSENRLRVICFDYFDTLVSRSIVPESTKSLAARQLSSVLGCGLDGPMLYELRRVLEVKICQENVAAGLDPDFNLYQFAGRFFRILLELVTIPQYLDEDQFVQIVADIEVQVEKATQHLCSEMVELLAHIKRCGITTCLISDFYLPGNHFRKILQHNGLHQYLDAVYISADFGVTKGCSGRLYRLVCEQQACSPSELLMIGDNVHADVEMARLVGLNAYHLASDCRREMCGAAEQGKSRQLHCKALLEQRFLKAIERQRGHCFPEMGISLWLFTHRLFGQLIRDQVPVVFFCSKEGEFLKRLFLMYQEQRFGRCIIPAHYLLVSRKATYICSLRPLPDEDFARLFVHYHDLSLKEFLLSLNFSEKQAVDLCNAGNLDPEHRYQNLNQQTQFAELIGSRSFQQLYEEQRINQRKNFLQYLESFQVDFKERGLYLVDVGWKGSIQNNIFFALQSVTKVHGYYIGLLSPTEIREGNCKTGLLFSDVPSLTPFIHVYNNNRSLFEMLLGASHGSADGYFSVEQFRECAKERKSTTFKSALIPDNLCATVLDLPEERSLFDEQILPIQEALLKMVGELTDIFISSESELPEPEWFARRHARMVFSPKKKEIDFFSGLYHLENFGLFEFTDFLSKDRLSLPKRLKNLRMLLQNPAAVLETGVWPPVILKRLGLDFLRIIDAQKRYRKIFGTYE